MNSGTDGAVALLFVAALTYIKGPLTATTLLAYAIGWYVGHAIHSRYGHKLP